MGASRDSIAAALAQQFSALNGEAYEFNYRLAHDLIPTLDEVRDAGGDLSKINMGAIRIDQIAAKS